MHFLIGQGSLQKLVSIAQSVVPKRTTKVILTHLLLDATEDGLSISATDDELSFVGNTEAQVEAPGKAVVSAKDLYDIVRNLPSDDTISVKWNEEEKSLELSCGTIVFQLQTLPAEEYPELPTIEPETSFSYAPAELIRLIEKTIYAVSQEETRYYLGGVFLECPEEGPIRAVATDGHRLALAESTPPQGFSLPTGHILPRKLLGELRKVIDKKEDEVKFGFQDRRVLFQYGSQTLISLLIEGSFPDYQQVIPKAPSITCRVPRVEFLDALKRISLLSPDKTGGIRFTVEDQLLTLSSQHSGRGKGQQVVEVKEGGGNLEVGFNARYFIEALQSIDTADVLLELTNHLSPCLLRPFHEEADEENVDTSFSQTNVVMPMRL